MRLLCYTDAPLVQLYYLVGAPTEIWCLASCWLWHIPYSMVRMALSVGGFGECVNRPAGVVQ